MKRFRHAAAGFAILAFVLLGLSVPAEAQRRNERQVRDLVRSLNSKIDDFQYGLDYQMRSSSAGRQDLDDARQGIANLQAKVSSFEDNLMARRENRDDVREIVTAARDIEAFLTQTRQNQRVRTDWNEVRGLIDRLSAEYGVVPDWSGRTSAVPPPSQSSDDDYQPSIPQDENDGYPVPAPQTSGDGRYSPSGPSGQTNSALSGTFRLDVGRSENTADLISTSGVSGNDRQDLESKLEAPEEIALEVRGNQVTLASSKAAPVSFIADGREKVEQDGGRTVRLRATLSGQELTVSSLGGESDYTIKFISADNGRTLRVTRRITTAYLPETIFAESVYTRTDSIARLGIDTNPPVSGDNGNYSSTDPNDRPGRNPSPVLSPTATGQYIVPNGTMVTGILEHTIDTKISQNNDRFRMTVQSPDEFRGAVIEGYLTGIGRSGQISGRSNVTFNFERITLRSGQSYDFAGFLQSVKDQYGKPVKVDTEGTARGDSQTRETVKRGGIGAGLGALIGAIAGGAKGAAIGAIIGGGAGAGSVVVQGRDDLQLMKGSTFVVQATAPGRTDPPARDY